MNCRGTNCEYISKANNQGPSTCCIRNVCCKRIIPPRDACPALCRCIKWGCTGRPQVCCSNNQIIPRDRNDMICTNSEQGDYSIKEIKKNMQKDLQFRGHCPTCTCNKTIQQVDYNRNKNYLNINQQLPIRRKDSSRTLKNKHISQSHKRHNDERRCMQVFKEVVSVDELNNDICISRKNKRHLKRNFSTKSSEEEYQNAVDNSNLKLTTASKNAKSILKMKAHFKPKNQSTPQAKFSLKNTEDEAAIFPTALRIVEKETEECLQRKPSRKPSILGSGNQNDRPSKSNKYMKKNRPNTSDNSISSEDERTLRLPSTPPRDCNTKKEEHPRQKSKQTSSSSENEENNVGNDENKINKNRKEKYVHRKIETSHSDHSNSTDSEESVIPSTSKDAEKIFTKQTKKDYLLRKRKLFSSEGENSENEELIKPSTSGGGEKTVCKQNKNKDSLTKIQELLASHSYNSSSSEDEEPLKKSNICGDGKKKMVCKQNREEECLSRRREVIACQCDNLSNSEEEKEPVKPSCFGGSEKPVREQNKRKDNYLHSPESVSSSNYEDKEKQSSNEKTLTKQQKKEKYLKKKRKPSQSSNSEDEGEILLRQNQQEPQNILQTNNLVSSDDERILAVPSTSTYCRNRVSHKKEYYFHRAEGLAIYQYEQDTCNSNKMFVRKPLSCEDRSKQNYKQYKNLEINSNNSNEGDNTEIAVCKQRKLDKPKDLDCYLQKSSEEDDIWCPPTQSIKKLDKHTKLPYSRTEKEAILNFIIKTKAIDDLGGNKIWKKMEDKNVCPQRTWMSMQNHYRRILIKELETFPFLTSTAIKDMRK